VHQNSDVRIIGSDIRKGYGGITVLFFIIIDDQYEINSIQKLYSKFPRLTYFIMNGVCRILRIMQDTASTNSSDANLR
jgi:hypothetical protein